MLQKTPIATEFPYADAVTGSEKGPFVDTGVVMPFDHAEGSARRVYLSIDSIREMAEIVGLTDDLKSREKALKEAYNRGKFDAVKEGLDADVRRVAKRFGTIAERLAE